MTTVDDAEEAGARAAAIQSGVSNPRFEDKWHSKVSVKAQWPILSAGLRELHWMREWRPLDGTFLGGAVCDHCRRGYPCATVRELDRIDKELGL